MGRIQENKMSRAFVKENYLDQEIHPHQLPA